MEILMVTGLLAYIMNYIIGKNKNSRLAQAWFNSHRELLESNFALVGERLFLVLTYFVLGFAALPGRLRSALLCDVQVMMGRVRSPPARGS